VNNRTHFHILICHSTPPLFSGERSNCHGLRSTAALRLPSIRRRYQWWREGKVNETRRLMRDHAACILRAERFCPTVD